MIINFIKLLIDAPGKLTHALVSCTKYLFVILFAIFAFHLFFGAYWPAIPKPDTDWIDFIFKGHVLLYIFFYVISYFILFELFHTFYVLFLRVIAKHTFKPPKNFKDISQPFIFALSLFDLIRKDKTTGKIRAAKNTDQLHSLLEQMVLSEESEDETPSSRSLISDLSYCYTLFAIYYFTTLASNAHLWGLTLWIFVGMGGIHILYIVVQKVYDFLDQNAAKLLKPIDAILLEKEIEEALREIGIVIFQRAINEGNQWENYILYNRQEYKYHFLYTDSQVTELLLRQYISKIEKTKCQIVLFTNNQLNAAARTIAYEFKDRLFILTFEKAEDLPSLVRSSFNLAPPFSIAF